MWVTLVALLAFVNFTGGANYVCPIVFHCTVAGCTDHMFDIHLSTNDMITQMGKTIINDNNDTLEFSHGGYSMISKLDFPAGNRDEDLALFANAAVWNESSCINLGLFDIANRGYRGVATSFHLNPQICSTRNFGLVLFEYKDYKARDATRIEISATLMHEAFHILGLDHECGGVMKSDSSETTRVVSSCIRDRLRESFQARILDDDPPPYPCLLRQASNYSSRLIIRDSYKLYVDHGSVMLAIPVLILSGFTLAIALVCSSSIHEWITDTDHDEVVRLSIMN